MLKQICYLFLLLPFIASAQQSSNLSYQQAVELALKNNYDIQVASNKASITQIQNSYGNAGFLPRVDINASAGKSNNSTKQEFSSGLSVDKNGATSNNLTAGAYLSWTIFDGLKMFATKEKLNILQQEGEISLKIQIENTLESVSRFYYQLVKQEQLIQGIKAAMQVSEERIKIAQKKSDLGSGSDVELLQAKLDLNAQKSNLIAQRNLAKEYKSNLILVLKADPNQAFSVDTVFVFDAQKNMDDIRQNIEKSNLSLLLAQKNVLIGNQLIKEVNAQSLPKIGLSSNYVFGRTENTAGFSLLNQNLGYNLGVNFSWNLFNGFVTKSQSKVAKLQYQNYKIEVDNTKNTLFSAANIAYLNWLGNKEILDLEEENSKLALQALTIATERMRLGLGNYLEIKESQSSYEAAIARLVNARFNLKQDETALKKITGELVK